MSTLKHRFEIEINASPEAVWRGITDPAMTQRYFHATRVHSDWAAGSKLAYLLGDDNVECVLGQVLEAQPPRRLVHTWQFQNPNRELEPFSRVAWEIVPVRPGVSRLILEHDEFPYETVTYKMVGDGEAGWPLVLAGLKATVEEVLQPQAASAGADYY